MPSERLLALLACPACGGALTAADDEFRCDGCGRDFPVRRGIPRLLGDEQASGQKQTAERFGWQWQHFRELHPELEREFLDWVHPLERSDFAGKTVLDAGCGFGRHVAIAAGFGCDHIVGMDLSTAVDASPDIVGGQDNVSIVQADLLHPPFRSHDGAGPFDLVYSIGVLHHLPDPASGFASLARLVRPGGLLSVWVYGWEGNAIVRAVVEPLRRSLVRRPPSKVRIVALPLAALLFALVRTLYAQPWAERLPAGRYLRSLREFTFRHVYNIVFDQLVAPTTAYIPRGEIEAWFRANGFDEVCISRRNANSWRGLGRKPHPRGSTA
jgi:SAM-dependent methyltransferase